MLTFMALYKRSYVLYLLNVHVCQVVLDIVFMENLHSKKKRHPAAALETCLLASTVERM